MEPSLGSRNSTFRRPGGNFKVMVKMNKEHALLNKTCHHCLMSEKLTQLYSWNGMTSQVSVNGLDMKKLPTVTSDDGTWALHMTDSVYLVERSRKKVWNKYIHDASVVHCLSAIDLETRIGVIKYSKARNYGGLLSQIWICFFINRFIVTCG